MPKKEKVLTIFAIVLLAIGCLFSGVAIGLWTTNKLSKHLTRQTVLENIQPTKKEVVAEVIGKFETLNHQEGYIVKDSKRLIFLPFDKGSRADQTKPPEFVLLDEKEGFTPPNRDVR